MRKNLKLEIMYNIHCIYYNVTKRCLSFVYTDKSPFHLTTKVHNKPYLAYHTFWTLFHRCWPIF